MTEEAHFKIELQDRIQYLKKQIYNTEFNTEKIIKIQAFYKGVRCRRFYQMFQKHMEGKNKKNTIILIRKYIIRQEKAYFLRILYMRYENSIGFKVLESNNPERQVENKQKLFEVYSLNQLKSFAVKMSRRVLYFINY